MIGKLVHDYALGKNGIVVNGAWTEKTQQFKANPVDRDIDWEWLVLYEDGEITGADTNDLQEIE
jgi:hypothetical protein